MGEGWPARRVKLAACKEEEAGCRRGVNDLPFLAMMMMIFDEVGGAVNDSIRYTKEHRTFGVRSFKIEEDWLAALERLGCCISLYRDFARTSKASPATNPKDQPCH